MRGFSGKVSPGVNCEVIKNGSLSGRARAALNSRNSMKKKAIPPFALTAGQSGRLEFNFTLSEGAAVPVLRGALMVHGERVDMVPEEGALVMPPLPTGVFLCEVRAGGVCVLYGHVEVLPSPLFEEEGMAAFRVDVDATADVLHVHISMLEGARGPRGASAYELAAEAGYEGTLEEWLAELQGAAAAANAAKASAAEAQRHELLAAEFKYAAGTAMESAENSAIAAEASATFAAERAADAATCSAAAARGASTAETEASRAAARAEAAATSASVAQEAKAAATTAADTATEARTAATTAAEQAAATLASSAKKDENNTFSGTNTFNGQMVVNSGITLGSQSIEKLLAAPSALELMTAGWHPLSGEASTFEDWAALNPDWQTRELLVMYAPKIIGALPIFTDRNAVKSSVIVFSGYLPYASEGNPSYNYGVSDMRMLTFSSYFSGGLNVYNCKRMHLYAPNVTEISPTNTLGYLNATQSTGMDVVFYLPKVARISQNGSNSIFTNWGPISSLSCYMPLVVNSFNFGRNVSDAAQTCAVLKSLVRGLGTPDSEQTITVYKTKDGNEIEDEATGQTKFEALQEFSALKNWTFIEKE